MPVLICPNSVWSVLRSVVRGLCVKLSPAKATIPMRSLGLSATNLAATSFAAVIRSGSKSRASMLVDTSIASTISIPSVVVELPFSEFCGRANATSSSATAVQRNTNGRCRAQYLTPLDTPSSGTTEEMRNAEPPRRTRHT